MIQRQEKLKRKIALCDITHAIILLILSKVTIILLH